MIPSDIKLFTWVDVEEVLVRIPSSDWPEWLVSVRAYWDGLNSEVVPQSAFNPTEWLSVSFRTALSVEFDVEGALGKSCWKVVI